TPSPPPPRRPAVTPASRPAPAVLVLSAARGPSWLWVRTGTETGPVVYEGTLLEGHALRFGLRKPLWIRLGAPWNLDATIKGRPATPQPPSPPGNVFATAAGIEPTA